MIVDRTAATLTPGDEGVEDHRDDGYQGRRPGQTQAQEREGEETEIEPSRTEAEGRHRGHAQAGDGKDVFLKIGQWF
jgi:hypothetical protein